MQNFMGVHSEEAAFTFFGVNWEAFQTIGSDEWSNPSGMLSRHFGPPLVRGSGTNITTFRLRNVGAVYRRISLQHLQQKFYVIRDLCCCNQSVHKVDEAHFPFFVSPGQWEGW